MTTTVTIQAPFTETDKPAALRAIATHNNGQPNDDEGNPTNQLPSDTNAEIKASYETILAERAMGFHAHQTQMAAEEEFKYSAKTLWRDATEEQRDAAIAALQS